MVLGEYLANYKTMGTFMYSKSANKGQGGYVKVGATFDTYEYSGNQVSFVVDRALTREYPDKGYGVCIDLTADKTTGTPAVGKFTLTGKDFITNKVLGVGRNILPLVLVIILVYRAISVNSEMRIPR